MCIKLTLFFNSHKFIVVTNNTKLNLFLVIVHIPKTTVQVPAIQANRKQHRYRTVDTFHTESEHFLLFGIFIYSIFTAYSYQVGYAMHNTHTI